MGARAGEGGSTCGNGSLRSADALSGIDPTEQGRRVRETPDDRGRPIRHGEPPMSSHTRLVAVSTLGLCIDAIHASVRAPIGFEVEPAHSLIDDLGFDSLGVVTLSVSLEDRFGVPILLDGWIASVSSPSALTVGSLAAWIDASLADEAVGAR